MARRPKKEQRPIHNRLRVLRAETGLSRADLAERVGVNPQTIGALERGDHSPSLDLAMSLSEVFSLPIEAVFNRQPFIYSPDAYDRQTQSRRSTDERNRAASPDHERTDA